MTMNPACQSSDIQAGGGSSIMVRGTLYWTLQKLLVKLELVLAGVTYIDFITGHLQPFMCSMLLNRDSLFQQNNKPASQCALMT